MKNNENICYHRLIRRSYLLSLDSSHFLAMDQEEMYGKCDIVKSMHFASMQT